MDKAITKPKSGILNHKKAITPITKANKNPFTKEIITSLEIVFVITSYSIHYTKLYEDGKYGKRVWNKVRSCENM